MIIHLLQKSTFYFFLILSILLVACDTTSPVVPPQTFDTTSPVITSPQIFSTFENKTTLFTVKATDSSSVSFSISSGVDKFIFSLNSKGILSFKSLPDFEKPSDSNKDNKYLVNIKATDSAKNVSQQNITIIVKDADETKPIFSSPNTVTLIEGTTSVITIKATDNNKVSYTLTTGDDSAKFTIQKESGELSFKTAPKYSNPTDKDKNNQYIVNITATDKAKNSASMLLTVSVIDSTIDLTGDFTVSYLGKGTKLDLSVDLGASPKTLYVLFTNHDKKESSTPAVSHNAPKLKVLRKLPKQKRTIDSTKKSVGEISHKPNYIRNFNANSRNLLNSLSNTSIHPRLKTLKTKKVFKAGDTDTFYMGTTDFDSPSNAIKATARKVVTAETNFGPKTLNIWVSDDMFDANNSGTCSKNIGANHIECVTQEMVNELAEKFLKGNGKNNDTYDWVTNIYGEEWGTQQYAGLIKPNNEISILLSDIGNDFKLGGVIGYFYAKDHFLKSTHSGSNQRVMFYLDAIMFASTSGANYWRKAVYATLTHEFTHLIEFYQKDIKLLPSNKTSDTWLAEMVAESTEYLTSYQVQHDSPRGIFFDNGSAGEALNKNDRYPEFNKYNNTFALNTFSNTSKDYSKVSSFGTFLVNNYGGAQVLHDILHSSSTNENAIIEAVNKHQTTTTDISFGEVLRNWGIAILLSDKVLNTQSVTPHYNTGGFTNLNFNGFTDQNGAPSGNSTEYKIGSINFFNYSICPKDSCTNISEFQNGPTISTTTGEVMPYGNFFYKVGDKLTGKVTLNIDAGDTIETTLIAK
jgi:hypothetical protein